jgi:hypothetical protein
MKVFLSWSGTRSHKVALVFRDWLPSVIQEIVPYVSSEDIDKGARWSTDIAKELSDSTFGILCVTRENINAPWLTFEAGALSKTMDKAFVSPFLFDIKRSEVDGPILQFQSTIFEKEDLKKLITTLNKACEKDGLTAERLSKAFEVWYPTLESELEKLRETEPPEHEGENGSELQTPKAQEILEEILELSRINQKLIRNPDGSLGSNLEEISSLLRTLIDRADRFDDPMSVRKMRKFHPMMLDELMDMSLSKGSGYVGIQIALGLLKEQFPWIYDAGMEAINILRSRRGIEEKHEALDQFRRVMEFSFEHPIMRDMYGGSKEMHFLYRRLPERLIDVFERNIKG